MPGAEPRLAAGRMVMPLLLRSASIASLCECTPTRPCLQIPQYLYQHPCCRRLTTGTRARCWVSARFPSRSSCRHTTAFGSRCWWCRAARTPPFRPEQPLRCTPLCCGCEPRRPGTSCLGWPAGSECALMQRCHFFVRRSATHSRAASTCCSTHQCVTSVGCDSSLLLTCIAADCGAVGEAASADPVRRVRLLRTHSYGAHLASHW